MGRTDVPANSGSSGRPPPEATWAAIEEALKQAGTRDPGLHNALMQAKNLCRSDPAGAQRVLDEIHCAGVLVCMNNGFMDVDAAGPWQQSPGRAAGEASAGRASSGRTISISSGGGIGHHAAGVFGGGDGDSGGLQRDRGAVMEEWQNMLIELMSSARIDDDRMQNKLMVVLQFLERSQFALSSHLAQELGRVVKTAGSSFQAQADIRALILEFEHPVYRRCMKCSAQRLVRCKPEPPANHIWCGHPSCVFSDRTCKPGGWDESSDYEKLFPRPLIDAAVAAHGKQPRKLRRLQESAVEGVLPPSGSPYSESGDQRAGGRKTGGDLSTHYGDAAPMDGAAAGYQGGGVLPVKRSAHEGPRPLHQEPSRQHRHGAPHAAGVMSEEGALQNNEGDAYNRSPQLAVGGYTTVTTVVRGDDDQHPLVMESSLRPWLPSAQPTEGAPAEDRKLRSSNSWPGLKPSELRATQGTPSEGNAIHFKSGHAQGYTAAPMTMRLFGDGSRFRLVPDMGGLSIGGDVDVPADAGISTSSVNKDVHQAGLLRVTIEPVGHRQYQQQGVVLAPGQWRLCTQRMIEPELAENARETAMAKMAAGGPESVSGRGAGLPSGMDRDRDVVESRQMMRGAFGEKGEAAEYPACSRGRGAGGEAGAPPLSFASAGAGPEDSTGSGRPQGAPLHPNWVPKTSRDGPANSDDSCLQLAMTRSLMTSAGTLPHQALQAQPSFTQQPQRQVFPAQDASDRPPPQQVHTQSQAHMQPSMQADRQPQPQPHLSVDIQQLRHLLLPEQFNMLQQQLGQQALDQGRMPHPETSQAPRMVHSNTQRVGSMGPKDGPNGFHTRASVPQTQCFRPSQPAEPQAEVVILPDGRRALVLPEPTPTMTPAFEMSVPMQGPTSSTGPAMKTAAPHGQQRGGVMTGGGRTAPYADSTKGVVVNGGRNMTYADSSMGSMREVGLDEQQAGAGEWRSQPVQLAEAIQRRRQQQQPDCPTSVSYGTERTQAGSMVVDGASLDAPDDQQQHQPSVAQASYHLKKSTQRAEGIEVLENALVAVLKDSPATAAVLRQVLKSQKQDFYQEQQQQPTPTPSQQQQQQQQERRQQPGGDAATRSKVTDPTASLPAGTAAGANGATSSISTLPLPVHWTSPSGALPAPSAGAVSSASTGARVMRTPDGRAYLVEPVHVPGASVDGSHFSGSGGAPQHFGGSFPFTAAVAMRSAPAAGTVVTLRTAEPAISNQTVSAPPISTGLRSRLRLQDPAASDSTGSGFTLGPAAATVGTAGASAPTSSLSSDVRHGSAVRTVHGSAVTLPPPQSGRAAAARAMRTPAVLVGLTAGTGQPTHTWAPAPSAGPVLSSPPQYAADRALIRAPEMLMDGPGTSAVPTGARNECGAMATMDAMVQGGAWASALPGNDVWHPIRAGLQIPRGMEAAALQPAIPLGRDMGGRNNGRMPPGAEVEFATHRLLNVRGADDPMNGVGLPAGMFPRTMTSEELEASPPAVRQSYLQTVLSLAVTPLVERAAEQLAAPVFGDKPQFLWHLPSQGDTATMQWSARIMLRACDPRDSSSLRGVVLSLRNDAELMSMCADLPTTLVPYLPSVMAAYEVRPRKDIPVTVMKGQPHMGWLSPDATRQQREALERLALAKIALYVRVDDEQDYIISPEMIGGCIMLVGVVLLRGPALHAATGAEMQWMQAAGASGFERQGAPVATDGGWPSPSRTEITLGVPMSEVRTESVRMAGVAKQVAFPLAFAAANPSTGQSADTV